MKLVLLIGAAGFLGTLSRYGCVRLADHLFPGGCWETFAVNILGAFAAGFLYVFLRGRFPGLTPYLPVVFIGFLGAFTTFSTFMLESVRFLADRQYGKGILNIVLQNGTGLAAVFCGMKLARFF